MPRLAIIISAVNTVESLETTLVSVLENRPADCEIVVALNGAYDDPYDLKDEVRFLPPARRAAVMPAINRALAEVRAPLVHLLASGCQVSEGWADAAIRNFGDRQIGSVVPLVWDAAAPDKLLAAGVGYRQRGKRILIGQSLPAVADASLATILGPASFAAFYRKAALDLVGGFSTQLGPRQADVDMACLLRRVGFGVAVEPNSRIVANREVDAECGSFREALYNERLFWRNLPASGKWTNVAAHLGLAGWEMAANFPRPQLVSRLAGRLLACSQFGSYARHQRLTAELSARAIQTRPAAPSSNVRIDGSHASQSRDASRTGQFAR